MTVAIRPASDTFTPRQQVVLTAALDLLVEAGDGLTMTAVARRASCSKETLYKWFGDRDGLLTATVQWQAAKVDASALRRFETGEQLGQRAFATAAGALQKQVLSSGNGQAEVVEHRGVAVPGETQVVYFDVAAGRCRPLRDELRNGRLRGQRPDALRGSRRSRQIERGAGQRQQGFAAGQ